MQRNTTILTTAIGSAGRIQSVVELLETRRHLADAQTVLPGDISSSAQYAEQNVAGNVAANVAAQVAPRRVYLIGNSLTDGVIYPGLTKLLQRGGTPVSLGRQTGSGYTQYKNFSLSTGFRTGGSDYERPGVNNPWGNYRSAFASGQWDAVTLQLHERRFFNDTYNGVNEADGAIALAFMRELQKNSPGAQPFIYSRPARRTDINGALESTGKSFDYSNEWLRTYVDSGTGRNNAYFSRSYITQFLPQIRSRQANDPATNRLKSARLIPVGEAYYQIDQMIKQGLFAGTAVNSILNLYTDQSHPTYNLASYIIGLTFHSAITGEDPRGVSVPSEYTSSTGPLTDSRVLTLVQQAVYNAITLNSYSGYSTPLNNTQTARGRINVTVTGDTNGDGNFDTGEPAIAGVRVYLDLNNNGTHESSETNRLTGADGIARFDNIAVGQYNVRTIVPTGYNVATPSVLNAVVTSGGSAAGRVVLRPASLGAPGTLRVTTFNDINRNNAYDRGESILSGQRVYLDLNNNASFDASEPSGKTSSKGIVFFRDLPPATYTLRQIPGSDGFRLSAPMNVTVKSGLQKNLSVPLQFTAASTGNIAVKIFNDLNRNAKQTSEEPGIPGVRVYLDLNNNSTFNSSEPNNFTEENGNVVFTNLRPGTYRVRFSLPGGYVRTDRSGDTVTVTAGGTAPVTIALARTTSGGGTSGGSIGSGTSAIRGTVVNDANKNRSWTSGESGIAGRIVWIDLDNDKIRDTNEPSRVTDSAGKYIFNNIAARTYYVRQVIASGWIATQPTAGFALTANITTGATRSNVNFFTAKAG
jgi:uncharacterized protein (DUF2141 family)